MGNITITHTSHEPITLPIEEVLHVTIAPGVRAHFTSAHSHSTNVTWIIQSGAHVTFEHAHTVSEQASISLAHTVTISDNAQFEAMFFDHARGNFERTFTLNVNGNNARARVRGVAILQSDGRASYTSEQNHYAQKTESDLCVRTVVTDDARFSYAGMIHVAREAHATQAHQENKNMLLSEQARATSVPSLQVLTDAVQCAHGSATGHIDQDALAYACMRGIPEVTARRLLLEGFMQDVFEGRDVLMGEVRRVLSGLCS